MTLIRGSWRGIATNVVVLEVGDIGQQRLWDGHKGRVQGCYGRCGWVSRWNELDAAFRMMNSQVEVCGDGATYSPCPVEVLRSGVFAQRAAAMRLKSHRLTQFVTVDELYPF